MIQFRQIFTGRYWLPILLLVVFLGDRLAGALLNQIVSQSQFRYSRLYTNRADAEILLAGNSRGLIFYQPFIEEKTGKTTFNLSYNGMPVQLLSILIKDHLDHYDAVKVLLLDITMLDRRMDERLIPAFTPYLVYSARLRNLMQTSYREIFKASRLSHIFTYNGEVFQRAFYYWKRSDEDWLLDREISPELIWNIQKQPEFHFEYTPAMLSELKSLVNYAQEKGINVRLLVNPYFTPYIFKLKNLPQLIESVERATGLPVHDYSSVMEEAKGFGDYQHLNKVGSKLYLEKLLSDGILPAR